MRKRISVVFILSLLIGAMAMPLAVAVDNDKNIIKEMVQAPADYSVSLNWWDYLMHWGLRYYYNYEDFPRHEWNDWRFYRLTPMGEV